VSFTVTPPLEVFVSILSTAGLSLENMYIASGFSLQANSNILATSTATYTVHYNNNRISLVPYGRNFSGNSCFSYLQSTSIQILHRWRRCQWLTRAYQDMQTVTGTWEQLWPFLSPLMTRMGTSGSWTWVHLVQVRHFNHWTQWLLLYIQSTMSDK